MALATLLFGFLAAGAPSAYAAPIPGDNGDVKIHAAGTPVSNMSDDTHVCRFYLDAFNFDTVQDVAWTISQQPPTGTAQVEGGTLVLKNGTGFTDVMSLPAGHYKLAWTFKGEHGKAKQKVFWSTCSSTPTPSPTGSGGGTTSTGGNGGGSGTGAGNGAGALGPNGKPVLARTGLELAPWLATGSGLLFGGTLLVRRRTARRNG